ncbi:hypothetical protein AB0M87_33250, partial [Streptomyces sp. NPDC051320]|uniref:hypothetical protein n=1 Tax=Streptomyces sp. NPDC051320 TaxID=3154644 RepID=UPI00342ACAE4
SRSVKNGRLRCPGKNRRSAGRVTCDVKRQAQPGSFVWDAQIFDLTTAQAKGGTLVYVDGEGTAHRWKAPASDAGPQVAAVKKHLQF